MFQASVRVSSGAGTRVNVDDHRVQVGHSMNQLMTHIFSDDVPLGNGQVFVNDDVCVGKESVTNPTHLDSGHSLDTRAFGRQRYHLRYDARVDSIHEAHE